MLKIKINKDKNLEFREENGEIFLNDKVIVANISSIGEGKFSVIKDNQSYQVEVVSFDVQTKKFLLKINGMTTEVQIQDKLDLILEKMGIESADSKKVQDLKAPMPGLISEIKVNEGDEVEAGQPLLILEAMKMENLIKAPGKGTVKSIPVKKGQSVEKNQVLIKF
jgi:biotin carboxyl carrier protein